MPVSTHQQMQQDFGNNYHHNMEAPLPINNHYHSNPNSPLRVPLDKRQSPLFYPVSNPNSVMNNDLDHFQLDRRGSPDPYYTQGNQMKTQFQGQPQLHPQFLRKLDNNQALYGM